MSTVPRVMRLTGGRALRGKVRVPGDKSISHRALLLAALAEGRSQLRGLSDGDDVARTAAALRALGAAVNGTAVRGFDRPRAPDGPLECGNSGTTMRLLAGLVSAFDLPVVLSGDESLSARPMDRIAVPLRAMGAEVTGHGDRCLPPISLHGGALHGIDYTPPVASAQVKSCVLLAGLGAAGETVVREPVPTRRHTEELLARCGAQIAETEEDGCHVVRLRPSRLTPLELEVPGDPSQAAFWVVATTVVPGSDLVVEGIYVGPQRRGFLDVLARMGAQLTEVPAVEPGAMTQVADVHVRSAPLRATEVQAAEITGLDEVPVLAVAAALAEGTTVFHDVGELRVKESDRLAGVVALVRAFGGVAEADGDDLAVTGVARLHPARVDAAGDHRMAMAAAVAAMAAGDDSNAGAGVGKGAGKGVGKGVGKGTGKGAGEETVVDGWEVVATSYPAFEAHLRLITGLAEHEVGA